MLAAHGQRAAVGYNQPKSESRGSLPQCRRITPREVVHDARLGQQPIGLMRRLSSPSSLLQRTTMGNQPETPTANGNSAGHNIGARIAKIGRGAAWVVPITAIATITLSALQLEITPDAWQKPVADAINPVATLKTDPLVCLKAGSVMLTYWLAYDGWDAIIKGSIMIGIKTAWSQVKEEIRVKAHAEGRAEVYAELKGKTLSEIAAELGIDESSGANGSNTPAPDSTDSRPENAC